METTLRVIAAGFSGLVPLYYIGRIIAARCFLPRTSARKALICLAVWIVLLPVWYVLAVGHSSQHVVNTLEAIMFAINAAPFGWLSLSDWRTRKQARKMITDLTAKLGDVNTYAFHVPGRLPLPAGEGLDWMRRRLREGYCLSYRIDPAAKRVDFKQREFGEKEPGWQGEQYSPLQPPDSAAEAGPTPTIQ